MIIDCISDLHGNLPKLPGGDLLIVAGDLTGKDERWEYLNLVHWLNDLDYREKIIIAGNHDNEIQNSDIIDDLFYEFTYLQDSGTKFDGLKFWGSPWTLKFEGQNRNARAFTCSTDGQLAEKWALIPEDTDILITHSPPFGILDIVLLNKFEQTGRQNVGSLSLNKKMKSMKTRLHIFGHVHEFGGKQQSFMDMKFINASHVDQNYDAREPGYVRVDL